MSHFCAAPAKLCRKATGLAMHDNSTVAISSNLTCIKERRLRRERGLRPPGDRALGTVMCFKTPRESRYDAH